MLNRHCVGIWRGWGVVAVFSSWSQCCCWTEEEREQVERLRWPSRGYLQELSEYQQRRRQLRKSRCSIMWPPASGPLKTRTEGHENEERWVTNMKNMQEAQFCQTAGFVALRTLTTDPVTLARGHVISRDPERTLWPQAYCVSLGALWHGSGFVYTQRNCSSKRRPCTTLTVEATPSERTWRRIKIFEAEYGAQNHAIRNFRLNETKSKSHLE